MNLEDLSKEQFDELQNCATPEEALALIKKHGLKLNEEQLDLVSGGWSPGQEPNYEYDETQYIYECDRCGAKFKDNHDRVVHIAVEHAWKDPKPHDWTY